MPDKKIRALSKPVNIIMKHFFKHGIELSILLLSLLACESNKDTLPIPLNHTTDTRDTQHLSQAKDNQEEWTFDGASKELVPSQEEEEWSFDLKHPIPAYTYSQDKVDEDEPMTIIGFPGLTDTKGPTTLIEPLLDTYNIGKSYTMVTRASENQDVGTHIQDAYRTLREEDRLRGRLLLIPESFGTYPAYGLTVRYPELNIAGMISIHAPWEGVSGAAHIIKAYQKLQTLHLGWLVGSSLDYYQLSNYNIPKALATLSPHASFLQEVKETLPEVKYPILALAGKSTERTGPYAYLYKLCKESKWGRVYSLGASMVLGPVDHMLQEYELGNDGLVTTASALAENIANKPIHFKGVIADATHFHYDLNKYPRLCREVKEFLSTLGKVE